MNQNHIDNRTRQIGTYIKISARSMEIKKKRNHFLTDYLPTYTIVMWKESQ